MPFGGSDMSKRHTFDDGSVADFDDDITDEFIQKFGDGSLGDISDGEHASIVNAAEAAAEERDDNGEPDGINKDGD